jgi:copper chaperone
MTTAPHTLMGYILCDISETMTYTVPGIHCAHCEAAIKQGVGALEGVAAVDVDLQAKLVTVRGERLEDERLRAAIDEAGYEVA